MTLSARLSVFFLGTLAAVLVGFSVTLYLLARTYLHAQVDHRLEAALNTLAAATEPGPDGVEWEGDKRLLVPGPGDPAQPVHWLVCDDRGGDVKGGRSQYEGSDDFVARQRQTAPAESPGQGDVEVAGRPWRLAWRRVQSEGYREGRRAGEDPKYRALVLTAGLPLRPVETALRNLALLLTGLSAGLWLLAAFAGRRLGRRALVPVTRMAEAARAIGAADLDRRLPAAGTGDELEDLGRAFNDLLGRLQQSFERQRRFTGDASHQLRTPLAAMLGQVEVALRRPRPAEEYREVLTLVQGQAGRLRQIVDMLLFLARADAEAKLPHLETIDLAGWLEGHLAPWSGNGRGADLRLEVPVKGPVWVKAQAPLLGQLLDNLLDNACKYSAPGTPITLSLGEEDGFVSLAVADAGCGIAPEDLAHVFEPFFRSAEARRLGKAGVGLGLAVAQRIAAAFGGALHVESRPGQGARFTLRLPRAG
jgi:heavy metal sensor kinase